MANPNNTKNEVIITVEIEVTSCDGDMMRCRESDMRIEKCTKEITVPVELLTEDGQIKYEEAVAEIIYSKWSEEFEESEITGVEVVTQTLAVLKIL